VTTESTMGAYEPSDDAIVLLARRHGLDPLAPSAASIQYLDQAIERVARAYLTAAPAELTEEVRLHVAWVRRLLDNSRAPAQHHRLYVQFGYLTGILAQLSLAQGDHDATQGYCAAAMQAADEAGDGQLRAWILSIQAMLAAYTNRHQDVIDLTGAGLQAAGQAASATAVKLASLQARAHAVLGDRQAAEAALARARQTTAQVQPEEQERGLFAFPEEKLASHEGQVWLQLGAPERAQESLQRALRLLDSAKGARRSPVDQAMVRLHLTRSHAELGQFDEARQQAEEALALHRQRPVDHTRRRAHELATLLKPYSEAEATQKIPKSSPKPSCSAVQLGRLAVRRTLGALLHTYQLGDDHRSRQSTGGARSCQAPPGPGAAAVAARRSGAGGIDRSIRLTRVCLTASFGGFRLLWLSQRESSPSTPAGREWKEVP
jgi:tetratricopeptide (TPR) repeat protein